MHFNIPFSNQSGDQAEEGVWAAEWDSGKKNLTPNPKCHIKHKTGMPLAWEDTDVLMCMPHCEMFVSSIAKAMAGGEQ